MLDGISAMMAERLSKSSGIKWTDLADDKKEMYRQTTGKRVEEVMTSQGKY